MSQHARKISGFSAVRPGNGRHAKAAVVAGPFDVPQRTSGGPSLADALITGLLVVYPVLATVAAVVVGLSIAGPVA